MKTSLKCSYSVIENERFGLVFAKTVSIISGTGVILDSGNGKILDNIRLWMTEFKTGVMLDCGNGKILHNKFRNDRFQEWSNAGIWKWENPG